MTRFLDPDESFIHSRFNGAPDTDPNLIRAFKRSHGWFICERRNLGLTEKSCREMRQRALIAKKIVSSSSKCMSYVGDAYLSLAPCINCKEYPRGK